MCFWWFMGSKSWVKFQRHLWNFVQTIGIHTPQNVHFTDFIFVCALLYICDVISLSETGLKTCHFRFWKADLPIACMRVINHICFCKPLYGWVRLKNTENNSAPYRSRPWVNRPPQIVKYTYNGNDMGFAKIDWTFASSANPRFWVQYITIVNTSITCGHEINSRCTKRYDINSYFGDGI